VTITLELPDNLEAALKAQANANGLSEAGYVRTLLERDLTRGTNAALTPLESGYGSLAQYGPAPTADSECSTSTST